VLFVHKRSALFALLRARVSPGLSGQTEQMITGAAGQSEHTLGMAA